VGGNLIKNKAVLYTTEISGDSKGSGERAVRNVLVFRSIAFHVFFFFFFPLAGSLRHW